MSLNHDLSELFRVFAALLEIKGESVFKAIAFSKVSRILGDMSIDLKEAAEKGTLNQIEGIGASSQRIIEDFVKTGRSRDFDDAAASVPAGLIPMLQIPGLGPKTIALFWKERKITSIDELAKAIDSGAMEGLKGIGDKKLQSIKEGIAMRAQASQRMGIGEALPIAEKLLARVRELKTVKQAEIAGSLRRRRETIGDVDIVCSAAKGPDVTAAFVKLPQVKKILGEGPTKASVLTDAGLQVDLRVVPDQNFGAALLYFTGSKDHNVRIRGLAQDKGMTLNEWGLYKLSEYDKAEKKTGEAPDVKPVASKTEADIYKKLGMDYIEPEMREDHGEVDLALNHKLPNIIQLSDYRGDLHSHTTASDGMASIEQMAEAAIALGYEYLAITDHSKSSVIANGLSVERLLAHVKAIHKASDKIKKIKLLAGAEVDILVDGKLDYEDAVLKELDFVVASPHVSLKQDEQKATDRIVRAIENRYVNLIGHPTGRLINSRAGLPLDFKRVFKAAKETGTALEINAGYPRLDLNDVHARGAIAAGVTLSINTDAHSIQGFGGIELGLNVARRAWVTKENVINCMSFEKLMSFIAKKGGVGSGPQEDLRAGARYFLNPVDLWDLEQLARKPDMLPDSKGVYGWYVNENPLPVEVQFDRLIKVGDWTLLYIGLAGKNSTSRNTLRKRINDAHIKGTLPSTFRASLEALGIADPHDWLIKHARIAFISNEEPWKIETGCFDEYGYLLPLNIDRNPRNAFAARLKGLRKRKKVDREQDVD